MKSSMLHIKVRPEVAAGLKALAKKRDIPVGELVRSAVNQCYQVEMESMDDRQRRALAAYQGAYISIGKLADEMGMHVLDLRRWLNEHDITQNSSYREDDVANA